ncbi:purine-nucleoside phosphorylase [Candidatus Uabimicrobium sp. HlEnr_7]|uniref:purine-nucleoside phosphorylase n=1 Tax=Candidatus Uabimicrobium helgolandensis TaxID=3095367 RepID=UPI003556434D
MDTEKKIQDAASYVREKYATPPQIGIILGSGFSFFQEHLQNSTAIAYKEIPNFPVSTVEGHAGNLVLGKCGEKHLCVMAGRFHYYEGYSMQDITFPVRVMASLGIKTLVVTNAAGGVNKAYDVGNFVLLKDHINLLGSSPLRGKETFGQRFVDMTRCYSGDLREAALETAKNHDIILHEGVYAATHGPNFETPAEIKMMRVLGADLVGMSTVPEVIVARQLQLKILGISCVTNMAAGVLDQELSHHEVMDTMDKNRQKFVGFIDELISQKL